MTVERPSLELIRKTYQVGDDEMIRYHPRLAGKVDIPLTSPQDLTRTEGAILDELTRTKGLTGLLGFARIAEQAQRTAIERYPDMPVPPGVAPVDGPLWQSNDGHRDAFRHTYWNALMAQEYGAGWTSVFATAHEARPGNEGNREAMDLYNNRIGRAIGAGHPDASPTQLAGLVQQALDNGRLVVLDRNGALEWGDRVRVGQHGLSPPDTIEPHIPVPQPAKTTSSLNGPGGDAADPVMAALMQNPLYLQSALALDVQQLNPLGAAAVTRGAMQAGLARVDRVQLGDEVRDADGLATRHLFAFGERLPGVAGRDYAVVTQQDLVMDPQRAASDVRQFQSQGAEVAAVEPPARQAMRV